MSVLSRLNADLAALREEGSIKENMAGLEEAMRALAAAIDDSSTLSRDKAACIKELRSAYEQIVTVTSGKEFTDWLDRVRSA